MAREGVTPIPLFAVFGTGGGDHTLDGSCVDPFEHWYHFREASGHDSLFWVEMRRRGFVPIRTDREFEWSGDVDGIGAKLGRVFKFWTWGRKENPNKVKFKDWFGGARHIIDHLNGRAAGFYVAIMHSHAGQLMLIAAALGLKVPVLITVSTPSRGDMALITKLARPNIGRWVHVYDPKGDRIGQLGQAFDGQVSTDRRQPLADYNVGIPTHVHSNILRDAAMFHHWNAVFAAAGIDA